MDTMSGDCCCLCRLPTSSDHRKRRRLHNSACAEARQVLVALSCGPYPLDLMLRDSSALLCNACHRDLSTIAKLEMKLQLFKTRIMANITGVIAQETESSTVTTHKRRASVELQLLVQQKYMHIDTREKTHACTHEVAVNS